MHEKRVTKAYNRELFGALAVYTILLLGALPFGKRLDDGMLRIAVLLSPMIGFGLMIWAIARHLGRIDEYMRRRVLESVATGAAITAGVTFGYGFLEIAGYPRLPMFTVWCVLCGSTGLVLCTRKLLGR
ncbi:MAG: hypothetical protein ACXW2U_17975 [Telluria sp.]